MPLRRAARGRPLKHSALRPLDIEALCEDSIRWVPIGSFMVEGERVYPDGLIRVSRGSSEANVSRRAKASAGESGASARPRSSASGAV
jgi:hypothetical protein